MNLDNKYLQNKTTMVDVHGRLGEFEQIRIDLNLIVDL